MRQMTNDVLQALIDDRFKDDSQSSELLLPVHEILRSAGISLRHYATALMKTGLTSIALSQLDALNTSDQLNSESSARASLLRLYLEEFSEHFPGDARTQWENKVLADLYKSLPYYQPGSPEVRSELRPVRVEVTSPLRIDLGMGGISDLPPWTNEQPGRAVSLCVNINQTPPIRCVAEVTIESGVRLESVGHGPSEIVSTWDELVDTTTPTAIARACLEHLFFSVERSQELSDFVASLVGGGLQIQTFSTAPKGLGSSSILASVVLQAMLRLLGQTINWQDLVHRTVTIERMTGVGGGWEDALPAFLGGIVLAESAPSRLPIINAKRLTISPQVLTMLQQRLILFDTQQEGHSGEVLAQGVLRYLSGDPATLKACDILYDIARQVVDAIEMGNIENLGPLLTEQRDAWKVVTGNFCTTDYIDSILAGAEPWIDGAKVNGAGSGGAILFVAKDGKLNQLFKYLQDFKGTVISWQPDSDGYKLREWYDPVRFASFVKKSFPDLIQARSSYDRHGEVVECRIEELVNRRNETPLVGPLNPAIFDLMPDLSLSILGVTAALVDQIGTATKGTLDSIKKLIDATASAVFSEEIRHWQGQAPVVTSEGKDEYGEPQPTVETVSPSLPKQTEFCTAVDVVDGTALSAMGQPGAYSIGAIGSGLRSFPDLRAYAILAPTSTFDDLDLMSPPELAIGHNLRVIAQSLGKRVDELVMVTPSEDIGMHHRKLVQTMQAQGVSVIVPDPVIVESPYVVAACIDRPLSIDGMVGVFGLPETVINTVLCGTLNRGKGFIFRVTGNASLRSRDQDTLDGILDLTSEEAAVAAAYGLRADTLYTFANIAPGPGCMFVGTAITDDPVLDIQGVTKTDDNCVAVEGLVADPCGNLYKLCVNFRRPSLIDYSARYPLPLFDISLVIELDSVGRGAAVVERIERLAAQIRHLLPGAYIQPFRQTTEGNSGLHITLYEFVVDYIPSISLEAQEEAFKMAVAATATAFGKLCGGRTVVIGTAKRTSRGVVIEATLDSQLKEAVDQIGQSIADSRIFNVLFARPKHHVAVARFTEVLTDEVLLKLDQFLDSFNEFSGEPLLVRCLFLKRATRTPFRDIQQSTAICFAG